MAGQLYLGKPVFHIKAIHFSASVGERLQSYRELQLAVRVRGGEERLRTSGMRGGAPCCWKDYTRRRAQH